jgi:AcrR family transcriptional regulator
LSRLFLRPLAGVPLLPNMLSSKPAKTPRWERRKDARPQELLSAALELFVERGYAATRLEDVGARAGVSKGTLYLYFENKEDLFKAVIRSSLLPVLDEAQDLIENFQGGTADLFREFILGWWTRIGDTPLSGITKLMMAEAGNFPDAASVYHDEIISRSNDLIVRILKRGIARGEFRKMDLKHANMVIVSPMLTLMLWKHSFGLCHKEPISSPEYLTCFIDLITHGLAVPGKA